MSAERVGSEIDALADIPIPFAEWNISNPSIGGFVTTADSGTLEVLLHLTQGAGNPASTLGLERIRRRGRAHHGPEYDRPAPHRPVGLTRLDTRCQIPRVKSCSSCVEPRLSCPSNVPGVAQSSLGLQRGHRRLAHGCDRRFRAAVGVQPRATEPAVAAR